MTRSQNPRRQVLAQLRLLTKNSQYIAGLWNQRQHRWDSGQWRALRKDEKLENSAEAWNGLAVHMRWIARTALEVAEFARSQRDAITQKEANS